MHIIFRLIATAISSGKNEFAETDMYWPVNHEIMGGDKAVQCLDCHAENGRMNWQELGYDKNPASPEEVKKKELMSAH